MSKRAERRARREELEATLEKKLRTAYAISFESDLTNESLTPQDRYERAVKAVMDECAALGKATPPQELDRLRAAARQAQNNIANVLQAFGATTKGDLH